jgi:hypothetical protein
MFSFKWIFATWWKKGVAKDTKMSPSHHIIRKNKKKYLKILKNNNNKMVGTFRCWGHGGCLNKGGFSKNSTIFAWHLTRFGSLMVCMLVSPLTWQNWKKIKIPGLFKTFGQFLCPIHALFYRAFSHPSFIILLFFPTPPIKLKLGQQQQQIRGGGTTNSKTIWTKLLLWWCSKQSEILSRSQIQFITLFSLQVHSVCCCTFFYQSSQTVQLCWA